LRTSAGDVPLRERVERFGTTIADAVQVTLATEAVEISGRMDAEQRGAFGERLRVLLRRLPQP
jgi:hypothetical protein